jgi:biopolymer transport protein ExbD
MGMAVGGATKVHSTPNVVPMIDIMLVLLIIFMVISPKKPHRFESQIPEKPPENQPEQPPDPLSLVVTVPASGGGYKLNQTDVPNLDELGKLLSKNIEPRPSDRKAVFIKAPKSLPYGEVAKVIDVVRGAGAQPIGLQIEGLDN